MNASPTEFHIEGTAKTPKISFDAKTGNIEFKGISLPENSLEFYKPVLDWLKDYLNNPAAFTTVRFCLMYMNSSSTLVINQVLNLLNSKLNPSQLKTTWVYEKDDFEMEQVGLFYKDLYQQDIILEPVEAIIIR